MFSVFEPQRGTTYLLNEPQEDAASPRLRCVKVRFYYKHSAALRLTKCSPLGSNDLHFFTTNNKPRTINKISCSFAGEPLRGDSAFSLIPYTLIPVFFRCFRCFSVFNHSFVGHPSPFSFFTPRADSPPAPRTQIRTSCGACPVLWRAYSLCCQDYPRTDPSGGRTGRNPTHPPG